MEVFGKPTLNPIIFFSGKILGYILWLIQFLMVIGFVIFERKNIFYNHQISFVILAIAMFFVVISLVNLGKSTRFGIPTNDTIFKNKGLYKISRNPMYIGINLLTISSMIYTLNLFVILIGVYSIFVYHLIILSEEKFLENRFGKQYFDYKNKVRRYL